MKDSRISSNIGRMFVSKGLEVSVGRTKVMVIGGTASDGLSKGKVYPFWICGLRVNAYSVL